MPELSPSLEKGDELNNPSLGCILGRTSATGQCGTELEADLTFPKGFGVLLGKSC